MTTEVVNRISVDMDRLTIKEFSIIDQDIVSFFKGVKEPSLLKEFESVLKVGVMAIKSIGVTEKVDYVEKEFNKLDSKINNTFTGIVKEIDDKLEEIFGQRGVLSSLLKQHLGEDGKLLKLFDPSKDGTPLNTLKDDIVERIDAVRKEINKIEAVEDIKLKTPLKGTDFEDYCEKILGRIVRIHGDNLERTSTRPGRITNSKKGDFVITLGNDVGKKIVLELKNDSKQYSLNEIKTELDQAKENREAHYGIFATRDIESLPESIGWFNECNGNKLACALGNKGSDDISREEILCIAYKWAKLKILSESDKEKSVNVEVIVQKIESVKSKLEAFKTVLTECGNIRRSNERITTLVSNTQEEVGEELDSIIRTTSNWQMSK